MQAFVEEAGLDGLWTDMNEPAVFRTPARTLPEGALHTDDEGTQRFHRDVHNLYGERMAAATRAGLERAYPERRPFVLTRSNHIGGARTAACWTGDNQSRWEDLRWSVSMTLSLALSGQPFAGPDVGGFFGDPTPELFVRWYELGAFLPFFRGHAAKNSCRKEPWAFGPEVEALVKRAIERRMRLLPHLYTRFEEAAHRGQPVVRALFMADPADLRLRDIDDAFLLGDSLLVAPVVEEGASERDVLLPRGLWYRFPEGQSCPGGGSVVAHAPLGHIPLFGRGGAIIVECEGRPSCAQGYGERLTLHVLLDADRSARGRLYEDAGEGFGYRTGESCELEFEARVVGDELLLEHELRGSWSPPTRSWRVRVYDAERGGDPLERELDGLQGRVRVR